MKNPVLGVSLLKSNEPLHEKTCILLCLLCENKAVDQLHGNNVFVTNMEQSLYFLNLKPGLKP